MEEFDFNAEIRQTNGLSENKNDWLSMVAFIIFSWTIKNNIYFFKDPLGAVNS